MAAPRVFISSTYYDLKQARNNIGAFIRSLGYEPVMHERSSVAYTQTQELEDDCYREISSCEIVVCIIGNHFGSKSSDGNHSITMNELRTALKAKKKIYVFISNDVFSENRTYRLNVGYGDFKSAYVDDLGVHKFIAELIDTVKDHVITPFETTDQIIEVLKAQFAGLFQNLLAREATLTDAKTAYDLQQSSDEIKQAIGEFKEEQRAFWNKFQGTIFANNITMQVICRHLGISKYTIIAHNVGAIDELMKNFGFDMAQVASDSEYRHYVERDSFLGHELILKNELFNKDGTLKSIRNVSQLEDYIVWKTIDTDPELPF